MTVKNHQSADLHSKEADQASKNGTSAPRVSMVQELGLKICPISEKIIKETSVKHRKAMEMLADL